MSTNHAVNNWQKYRRDCRVTSKLCDGGSDSTQAHDNAPGGPASKET